MQADGIARNTVPVTGYGLLGGVFDPVHEAHLRAARAALDQLPIAEVVFLPAGVPPHDKEHPPTAIEHRQAMLELALSGDTRLRLDDRERLRPGVSYTVLTLRELRAERPGETVFLLIGADNVLGIGRWFEAEELFELCCPVIIPRPGFPDRFTPADLPFLSTTQVDELNARTLTGVALDHSSTEVRDRRRSGLSLAGRVPPLVERYIEEHGLYLD